MRTDGQRYFRVDVEIKSESNNGKYKKNTEQYLTLATGCTEAEAQVIKNFTSVGDIRDYRVKNVAETKIVEVV
jgi:hypothetical protein